MKKITLRRAVELGTVMILLAATAASSQLDKKFAQSQQQNAQALRQYTWKSRTEVKKGGEPKSSQLNLMRYDADGSLQKRLVSSTSPKLPTRGIRGFIAQKKREEFVEMLDGLGRLARSYSELPPVAIERFMATATVTPEMGSEQKLIRASGGNLLQPGDSMTLWIDPATRRVRRVEVQATFEKEAVRIVSEFQDLPAGPTYMARSVIDYSSEELTVITENFDYERVER